MADDDREETVYVLHHGYIKVVGCAGGCKAVILYDDDDRLRLEMHVKPEEVGNMVEYFRDCHG